MGKRTGKAMAAIVAAFFAASASAGVVFDAATGTGFVGKGDVQSAFDWNNAQLQAAASVLGFFRDSASTYSAVCASLDPNLPGAAQPRTIIVRSRAQFDSAAVRNGRGKGQIDGFALNGYRDVSSDVPVPVEGGACDLGTWSSVTLLDSVSAIEVGYAGDEHLIALGAD